LVYELRNELQWKKHSKNEIEKEQEKTFSLIPMPSSNSGTKVNFLAKKNDVPRILTIRK